MNRAHFFLVLIVLVAISCVKKNHEALPATGNINTLSVIIDDDLWNGEVGDSIRNKFAGPVVGLPQEEPLFTINQYPVKLLEGYMTSGRNIIVIKKEPQSSFRIITDEYAKPQNVVHISGRTNSEILSLIQKNAPYLIKLMKQTELEETWRRIDTAALDPKKIQSKFGISLKIPVSYKYAIESEHFVWLKKEIISGNTSLLIYEVADTYLERNSNAIDNIIRMRDSIGNIYIHGAAPDTRMITEEAYAPYLSHITLDGRPTFETKGTWEVKNDFMSGPFINYSIQDCANKRILVLEGFCYAPSKEKRDLMLELEAMIKSIKFNKPSQESK